MPPSPGKIQALPIKVLYTIDTSPQSYLTVLPDKQDVLVQSIGAELVGSVALKALTKAICYASPECVPNRTSLDFTVYNLDPSSRAPAGGRAFPSPSASSPATSWTGRGFLSWALAERGAGVTLVRGRLAREYEFSPAAFAEGGGLEGLMAAARSEDADGKGWGLEVTLTLRQLNPEGKAEFAGRREFESMLEGGKSSAANPLSVTSPGRDRGFVKPAAPLPKQPSPLRRPVHNGNPPFSTNAMAGPSRRPLPSTRPAKVERARDVTPPPQHKAHVPQTPPTPSPSRARILEVLKSEASMSPNMAKKLVGNPFLVKLLKTLPESDTPGSPGRVQDRASAPPVPHSDSFGGRCENCGTTQSEQWFKKKVKGNNARVCQPCGKYYNDHRTMPMPGSSTPVAPVRSSPRLNKTRADPTLTESPRKRRKMPTPSPRMVTRASTRKAGEAEEATTPTPGGLVASLDFGSHFSMPDFDEVAPSTGVEEEQDLSSLFLQFQDEVPSAGVTLDNVFGTHNTNDILDLLRSLEGEGTGVSQSEP
ncbi:uncharacterized protein CcaverHIS019_0404010 [Cutaneotrichosporon cavernicola]|uniref:GATA-type domain-containing protein n=1 Tax=Cutaneotrichosporon cavernicola TaxID=279322 RepID=A0AA48L417_9TREE|nr:uncharacterized protein CcaverHIS019_0404010 [Cutaneotrichosporon cavernicola]BEI91581.1 hypothetical protein CcaverHIS019_0404010 [Cutaneotrichosporon cavernicola]BEI99358.1 hypothetical protein CcaverHIS631_0404010 [Cutaneotrichosporon cavernicola]BEJ07133.1 hypothetical protein CcaverHIS641_0404020 [Cutaneotrichosporon cavernicola]